MQGDSRKRIKHTLLIIFAWYVVITGSLYWIVGQQWNNQLVKTPSVSPNNSLGELSGNIVIEQPISIKSDTLDKLSLFVSTFERQNQSNFFVEILEDGKIVGSCRVQADLLNNLQPNIILMDHPLMQVKDKALTLRITMNNIPAGQGISLWYGSEIAAGKFSIEAPYQPGFTVNGVAYAGSLCISLIGRNIAQVEYLYWMIAAFLLCGIIVFFAVTYNRHKHGRSTFVVKCLSLKDQYRFLVKQLVVRDFKIKYKRSLLGIFWSFLNPLLTMTVQYIVFSTIFKTDVASFPVYLLTGIVMFSYFSEAVSLGMSSIVSNASLIKKVYMPKYIYPMARVVSSTVNLIISLIPLLLVMVLTGTPITKSLLLIPIPVFFLFIFSMGISFLLATSMVFFRDTQFLWGILVSLWMYFTPIFYPETIIPPNFLPLYRSNPMYQFIYFIRCITLDGISPPPINYLYCALCAVIPLVLGLIIFRKKQDKFVLYL